MQPIPDGDIKRMFVLLSLFVDGFEPTAVVRRPTKSNRILSFVSNLQKMEGAAINSTVPSGSSMESQTTM